MLITNNCTQRWKDRRPRFIAPREVINPRDYEIAEISDQTAKEYVLRTHYSGTYPAARRRFGLFKNGNLCGAAVFSHPMNDLTITNVFHCKSAKDGLELGRFVLDDEVPYNGESWFLGRIKERIYKDYVGFVSFSDDTRRTATDGSVYFAGHIGNIYVCSNMSFLGRGYASRLKLLPDGKVLSARTISKIRAGETGWRYAAELLTQHGANVCPENAGDRREWLNYWLPQITRPLAHPGNLKYAMSNRTNKRCI